MYQSSLSCASAVDYPEPHAERRRSILRQHPELRHLAGPEPVTGLVILAVVGIQSAIAIALADMRWWVIPIVAFLFGAFANLACWALIHEGAHNLVARTSRANRWWSMIANLPILVPAAATFRTFHRHHHRQQGDRWFDADLPLPEEVRIVGGSPWRKALWLMLFMPLQVVRASRLPHIRIGGAATNLNIAVVALYAALIFGAGGLGSLIYLLLSSWLAMGFHPLGARWIQEHHLLSGAQETTSYYGPANWLVMNCGYHTEHHDLPGIAWLYLPRVRRIAADHYDGLHACRSWSALLWRFLTDRKLTLGARVVRESPPPASRS